ncbi:MAG TPA: molybdopterin dinucleotide binding domain-containing protein, partial [Acidobacteriota bacterium]|nr:molybdopterin dinucleotide binding domain-containing protein [Acidobacteriota bacterium]
GESRSEWEIISQLGRHILPPDKQKLIEFSSGEEIRSEINRVIPLYQGIEHLKAEKDSLQYGGPILLEGGVCNTPDRKAHFTVQVPQNETPNDGEFYLTTRRGKQFNSIVYGVADPLTGSLRRDEIFLSAEDAEMLQLRDGDPVTLISETGEFSGACKISPLQRGTVMVHWPEGNTLIARRVDPLSNEPDYNTIVRIRK